MSERPDHLQEIEYYRRRLDELAGESLRLDYEISGLRKEVKQKRQAFTLLSRLQQTIGSEEELSHIFHIVLAEVNTTLGMDRTVVLTPTDREGHVRPSQWAGFGEGGRSDGFEEEMHELDLEWPSEFSGPESALLVNRETELTGFIKSIQTVFGLPYLVCVPVTVENSLVALLLSGRIKEAGSLYPPLDRSDVETFQAIAGLISRFVELRRIGVLKETDRLKTQFFANVSHEFRTPITLTLGPLEGILAGRFGKIPDAVREQGAIMQRNQQRLLEMVHQLLSLARLEAGRVQLRASPLKNLNAFVEERVVPFRSVAQQRGLTLTTSLDPTLGERTDVFVDRELFDELLANLLSNALKFTRKGSIDVSTRIAGDRVELTVSDTGVGIKADQLPYIFDRFRQADGSVSREFGGTGLGLAWVKEIADLHGGSTSVRSAYGTGSSFVVAWPLGNAHLPANSVVEFDEADLPKLGGSFRAYIVSDGGDPEEVNGLNDEVQARFDPLRPTVVYVEDNPDLRKHVRDLLKDDFNVFLACDGRDGLAKLRHHSPDLAIVDQMMPRMSGMELLAEMRRDPGLESIPVIFLTARAGAEPRLEGLEAGAYDYLTKPFDSAELHARVRNVLRLRSQERELREANRILEARVEEQMAALVRKGESKGFVPRAVAESLVSRSRGMQEVLELATKIADSSSTVLIRGETGTGKEMIARAIHLRSRVCDGPFVPVHCAAIPSGLLESELFGHEKGAFTGATARRQGRFELAHGGSLFLDEVGEIGPEAQVKLLRVLQERQFRRVGGNDVIQVDVRVIAATNRDLEQAVRNGGFREDLYYRVNVIPLTIPPLRERAEDIPLLVTHFLDRYRKRSGRPPISVSPDTMAFLAAYPWPGNVREIQNLMERLVVTVDGDRILPLHLPPEILAPTPGVRAGPVPSATPSYFATLEEQERRHIEEALRKSNGIIRGDRGAARLLGMPESTLRYRMKQHGISRGA